MENKLISPKKTDKFPRKLLWPGWLFPDISDFDLEFWKMQHDETSKTIRRLIMVTLGFCFFCFQLLKKNLHIRIRVLTMYYN